MSDLMTGCQPAAGLVCEHGKLAWALHSLSLSLSGCPRSAPPDAETHRNTHRSLLQEHFSAMRAHLERVRGSKPQSEFYADGLKL